MSELYDFSSITCTSYSDYLLLQTYNELFNHSLLIDNFISRLVFSSDIITLATALILCLHIIPQVYE